MNRWEEKPGLSSFGRKVDLYYNYFHFWTLGMVKNAVKKGRITKEEFTIITGYDYDSGNLATPSEPERSGD
nr:MAG TPA: hypothetical protein [Caudoviricetes sp.]